MKSLGEFPVGEDKIFFENVEKFLNIVSQHITGEIMGEVSVNCQGDVRDLLRYLKYGINIEKMLEDKKTLVEKLEVDNYMNMEI